MECLLLTMGVTMSGSMNEAPCSKLHGIKRNCAEANPPSLYELRRGRPAIHPCSKLQGILAKANKVGWLMSNGRARGLVTSSPKVKLPVLPHGASWRRRVK